MQHICNSSYRKKEEKETCYNLDVALYDVYITNFTTISFI